MFEIFICSFFNKQIYAIKETSASNATPIPNNNAIPSNVGTHTLVLYRINAVP